MGRTHLAPPTPFTRTHKLLSDLRWLTPQPDVTAPQLFLPLRPPRTLPANPAGQHPLPGPGPGSLGHFHFKPSEEALSSRPRSQHQLTGDVCLSSWGWQEETQLAFNSRNLSLEPLSAAASPTATGQEEGAQPLALYQQCPGSPAGSLLPTR